MTTAAIRNRSAWVGGTVLGLAASTLITDIRPIGLDYALLGAVKPTASHPERDGLGWGAFADRIRTLPLPVLALGGLKPDDLDTAKAHGAHGVAGIRSFWQG